MIKKIWIISLFPEYFAPLMEYGIVSSAFKAEKDLGGIQFQVNYVNPRDYAFNRYKSVDDYPFGGGPGMVMRADVLENTLIKGIVKAGDYGIDWRQKLHIVFPCPRGKTWDQEQAKNFTHKYLNGDNSQDIVFLCGRYEGVDERFLELYVDRYYSLGDYILSGGEIATMAMLDSCMRLVPGVLGNNASLDEESFEGGLLEHPQYTRPREFHEKTIPEELLSGHHARMAEFQKAEKLKITSKYRPDLLGSDEH